MKNENIKYLKVKKIDLEIGETNSVVINPKDAETIGVTALDKVEIFLKKKNLTVNVELSSHLVKKGEIGITKDTQKILKDIKNGDEIGIKYYHVNKETLEAIRKKIKGEKLNENEINSIIKDISEGKLSRILTTYYVASNFCYKTDDEEIYLTAKAMADNGIKFKYPKGKIIADKHCIGGIPGNETTMIIVPTITSLGITMPKNFSKAITSPAATGECVNVLMEIEFNKKEIEEIIKKVNGCLIWGGGLEIAPADDKIIKVTSPLGIQNIGKVVASIMAKKYAMGITHSLIDIPVGKFAKVKDEKEADIWKQKFEYVGGKLGIKVRVVYTNGEQPIGNGAGAVLQVREVLRVLQQHPKRPKDLEQKAIFLASQILENVGYASGDKAVKIIENQIKSGKAREQMQKIIKAQRGKNPNIKSEELKLAKISYDFPAYRDGEITEIDLKYLTYISRILGTPNDPQAGMYLHKKLHDKVKKGDILYTLYTNNQFKLDLALKQLKNKNFYKIN